MPVDKFGHHSKSQNNFIKNEKNKRKIRQVVGLVLDKNNNINVQNKRITNVSFPTQEKDAVNKHYLGTEIRQLQQDLTTLNKQEYKKLDGKLNNIDNSIQNMISHREMSLKLHFSEQIETLLEKVQRLENFVFTSIITKSEPPSSTDPIKKKYKIKY